MAPDSRQHLLLFGDQTIEKLSVLENVVKYARSSPLLQRFLDGVTDSLQLETSRLPRPESACFRGFHSLLDLAQRNQDSASESSEVVATVVLAIARLGELVLRAEHDPSILGSLSSPTEILGFCTGGIPAAVAAAATNTEELLDIAIESVGITLRLAFELVKRSEAVDDVTKPWAITCVGVSLDEVQHIIDSFHGREHTPESRRLSISIIGRGWLTIFGPPKTLDRLCAWSKRIGQVPKVPTDARSSVHTTFLPMVDIDAILGSSPLLNISISSKARILSPFTAQTYKARDLRELLCQIIPDIAQNAIHVEKAIARAVEFHAGKSICLSVMGKTQYLSYVEQALTERSIQFSILEYGNKRRSERRSGSGSVAIVGMSGRFPGSRNVDELWNNLLDGKDFVTEIPKSRFSLDEYYDPTHTKRNSTSTCFGTFLDSPGMFDYRLFNMSPREAAQIDPLMRLFLTTSYEALEVSGYRPDASLSSDRNRINTYFGQVSDDWRDVVPQTEKGADIYYVPGVSRSFAPSRLNYHFKWGGGSYSIDNACASSTTCVALACSALLAKECDMALAGGGSILQSPYVYAGLSRAGMLSPTGGCKTFRADADGYCRGEGVGVVVLKRLEDALEDNDNILAVIKGAARSYSNTATSMTHPSSEAQERLYRQVLRKADMSPSDISFLEMHGTGTQAGDLAEMSSVINTFTPGRTRDNPLVVGAIKASIGHGESAAGICSLIKTLMVLRTYKIPPQPGMPFKLNTKFPDLALSNIHIGSKGMMVRRKKDGGPLRAFVNSFDASGGNTCLALEEAPMKVPSPDDDPRSHHVVAVTGKTRDSLLNNTRRLLNHMKQHPNIDIADLSYTTTARRMHETLRSCYSGKTTSELMHKLDAEVNVRASQLHERASQVILVFTGQGSQYCGMGRDLFNTHAHFREMLQAYDRIATSQGLPSFLHLITETNLNIASESSSTVQLALVSLEIAMANLWSSWGIKPDLVIGHSLGEYAALCIAGVLSVSDTLHLIGRRALLIEKKLSAGTHGMLVVRAKAAVVQEHLDRQGLGTCQISLLNSPNMTVVSGNKADIGLLRESFISLSINATALSLPYGFHSGQLDPILDEFEAVATGVVFTEPKIPVASTLLGRICKDSSTISPRYLRDQMRNAVDFVGALYGARSENYITDNTLFIEVGPQPICLGFIATTLGSSFNLKPSLKPGESAWATLSDTIATAFSAGCSIDWTEYHRPFAHHLTLLDLPTYAFDETDFWTPFISPSNVAITERPDERSNHAVNEPKILGFPNSSLQQIVEWRVENQEVSASFLTDISETDFAEAVNGHIVNGFPLVPMGLFVDMAMSATRYVHLRVDFNKNLMRPHFSVHQFEITKPVVLTENHLPEKISTIISHIQGSTLTTVRFEINPGTGPLICGHCNVLVSDPSAERAEFSRMSFLTHSRVDTLRQLGHTGSAHQLWKPVVYRLFENLVKVGSKYRLIEHVVLGPDFLDASAEVTLAQTSWMGTFQFQPYWIDALVQVSGVLLNCGLNHPNDDVFISNGLEKWYFFEELEADRIYTSYVQYQKMKPDSSAEGDVAVFRENTLVSYLRGVRFQMMQRSKLSAMLSARSTQSAPKTIQIPAGPSKQADADQEPLVLQQVLDIIATESGAPVEQLDFTATLKEIGVDSLMAITIGAAVKDQLGLDLPGTFFLDYETIGDVASALHLVTPRPQKATQLDKVTWHQHPPSTKRSELGVGDATSQSSSTSSTKSYSSDNSPIIDEDPPYASLWTVVSTPASSVSPSPSKSGQEQQKPSLSSNIVHLGGLKSDVNSKDAFFLIADETGTIARYIQLPEICGKSLATYGVISPFLQQTGDTVFDAHDLVTRTAAAILEKTPYGPFRLGGYSVGGLIAYLVAQRLLGMGHEVDSLVLLDSPMPTPSGLCDTVTYEHLHSEGIIPGYYLSGDFVSMIPENQQKHVCRIVDSLVKFQTLSPPTGPQPRNSVYIYATDGLHQSVDCGDLRLRRWVSASWGKDGLDAWKRLIPGLKVREIAGHHFNMMDHPKVNDLGHILTEILARSN